MVDYSAILDQLEFRISGGETNINPFLSLGGEMSNAIPDCLIISGIFDNIWDDITVQERLSGDTSFRWIYFYNNSVETIYNLHMYMQQIDAFVSATWHHGGAMVTPTLQPDEVTTPPVDEIGAATDLVPPFTGITDSFDTTKETISVLGPLQWQAICLRRVIPAGTDSHIAAEYRLIIESRT